MVEETKKVKGKKRSRIKKSGWVYLLESAESYSFDGASYVKTYKYGATTKHFSERCRKINYCQKQFTFSPIAAFKSNDIYKDENRVAHNLIHGGFARMTEYVCCSSLSDTVAVKRVFLALASPFKERGASPAAITWEA